MAALSMIYSVGTLLSRAESAGQEVRVLVEGHWLTGTPLSSDGYGVILESDEAGQVLIRVEAISAVAYLPAPTTVPQQRTFESSYVT